MTGEIERYSFSERVCHWTAGLGYLYCLATGLAFYSPYLFWMAIALGGGPTSRYWHPWIGLIFFASTIWMHRAWKSDVQITAQDREWLDKTKSYATNQDQLVPAQGKFNAGQKVFYWAMFYGAILLLITGSAMWFPESIPASMGWIRPLVIILHVCAALITIGAFIIHVYMGVFMVPGSVSAMLFGYVSKDWAKAHHRLWYEETQGKPTASK